MQSVGLLNSRGCIIILLLDVSGERWPFICTLRLPGKRTRVYIDCEHETDERLANCPAVHTSNLIEHAGFVFS